MPRPTSRPGQGGKRATMRVRKNFQAPSVLGQSSDPVTVSPASASATPFSCSVASTGSRSARSSQKRIISSGDLPAGMKAALMAPAEVTERTIGPRNRASWLRRS